MRIVYTVILGLILAAIFLINYRKEKDLFCPMCFVSLMMFIRYIPNMIVKDVEHFSHLTESNISKLFWAEFVSIIAIQIGYFIGNRVVFRAKRESSENSVYSKEYNSDSNIKPWVIFLLFSIGMIARLRVILMSGGIKFITSNAGLAYISLSNGTGFLSMFSNFAIVAVMMELSAALQDYHNGNSKQFKHKRLMLIIMIGLYSFTFLIFTSRSPIFELLLFVIFGINYLWRKLRIRDFLGPRIILVIVISLAIIVILPLLRQGQTITLSRDTNIISGIFDEFSYVGRDTYVYDHFDKSNYWHGGNYKGFLTAFIPYSLYPQKPPIDDGIYLSNIMYGYWVNPPVSRDNLTITYSIPFSTPGILYANFGMIGIIIGQLLMGIIYSKVYKKLKMKQNVLWIIIFQLVVYQLELSTLSIMQTIIPLVITYLAYKPTTSVNVKLGN